MMEMIELAAAKAALRGKLRARRRAFVAGCRRADLALAFRIVPSPLRALVRAARTVGGYCAVGDEPDVLRLLTALGDAGGGQLHAALPAFASPDAPMDFRGWTPGDALVPGPLIPRAIPQPAADAAAAVPDVLLVPLLGFDRSGARLGQGGGHYDRYLAAHPGTIAVGIAWSVQEEAALPSGPHDQRLAHILTEREWIDTGA